MCSLSKLDLDLIKQLPIHKGLKRITVWYELSTKISPKHHSPFLSLFFSPSLGEKNTLRDLAKQNYLHRVFYFEN